MVVAELVDVVGTRVGPVAQGFDVGKHDFFFILEVLHHLALVFVVEMAEHVAIFCAGGFDDARKVGLDVREAVVEIKTV